MDRNRMTADFRLASLHKQEKILLGVLQQPDYPSLVSCPVCDEHPESVTSNAKTPAFGGPAVVLVKFSPCRHSIRIPTDEQPTALATDHTSCLTQQPHG
ncbi:hypothetical protein YW3DRAFT_07147 [Streptomyces sp. MnatMP-M77]|nr:hypothetical protein YW3DRAFT_07147 [Streptomyces sp. MnatMP-M77]